MAERDLDYAMKTVEWVRLCNSYLRKMLTILHCGIRAKCGSTTAFSVITLVLNLGILVDPAENNVATAIKQHYDAHEKRVSNRLGLPGPVSTLPPLYFKQGERKRELTCVARPRTIWDRVSSRGQIGARVLVRQADDL